MPMPFQLVNPTNDPAKSGVQGNIGLSRAIYELTRLGYNVLIPLTDINPYDLVVEKDQKFKTIQVKTASRRDKTDKFFVFNLVKKKDKHTKPKLYDFLFVLTANDECYIIPKIELPPTIMNLTSRFDRFKINVLKDPLPDNPIKMLPDPNKDSWGHLLGSMAREQELKPASTVPHTHVN